MLVVQVYVDPGWAIETGNRIVFATVSDLLPEPIPTLFLPLPCPFCPLLISDPSPLLTFGGCRHPQFAGMWTHLLSIYGGGQVKLKDVSHFAIVNEHSSAFRSEWIGRYGKYSYFTHSTEPQTPMSLLSSFAGTNLSGPHGVW